MKKNTIMKKDDVKIVMVIEDDIALSWLLARILKAKYEVVVMNNGLKAASWLMEGNVCHLILSDLNMPSLDGFELLENLRDNNLYNSIPVIIISALSDEKKRCIDMGARSYLEKPFEPQKLLVEIEHALYQSEHGAYAGAPMVSC